MQRLAQLSVRLQDHLDEADLSRQLVAQVIEMVDGQLAEGLWAPITDTGFWLRVRRQGWRRRRRVLAITRSDEHGRPDPMWQTLICPQRARPGELAVFVCLSDAIVATVAP